MKYRVLIRPKAKKEIEEIHGRDKERIIEALFALSLDPFQGKKLKGKYSGQYSFKVWPYRIIYEVIKDELIVFVLKVGYRQGVY
ncbi:MAG: type II toxin-antitoxin system RelE/ParE family toxin [bacterium]